MFGIGANAKAGCHVFREKLESQVRYCQRMMAEPEGFEPSIGLYNPITV
jgi:hypothetical protein